MLRRRLRSAVVQGLPAPLGAPLAVLYGGALVLRNAFCRPAERAAVPVICIGNLTTGGTGKTPATVWVAEFLKRSGRKPAVLLRGYGGDEGPLLGRLLPGTPVIEDADRVRGAACALAAGADVVVMDDGFQHRRLERDLDIVLVDATDPFGGGHLLPWGRLREPREALGRAGAVVITRADQVPTGVLEGIRQTVSRLAPEAVLAEAVHRPLVEEVLAGRKILAACGIGNPGAFRRTLEVLGAQVTLRPLPDHHAWTEADVALVNAAAKGMDTVMVTEKDWVKLEAIPAASGWKVLKIRLEVTAGREALEGRILAACTI